MKYEQLRKLIQAFSEPYRGTVYHYTTANGVAGIVGSHEIWMSNTAFTNDITELKMLQNPQNVLKGSDFTNDFVRQEWDKQRFREDGKNNYYMASFSRRKDSLEQWRAYGNFCIGFDARRLIVKKRVYLYRCLYTVNDIRRWILNREKIDEWKGLTNDKEKSDAAYNLVYVAALKYKNEHFKSEKEVRLITTSSHNWDFPNSPWIRGTHHLFHGVRRFSPWFPLP